MAETSGLTNAYCHLIIYFNIHEHNQSLYKIETRQSLKSDQQSRSAFLIMMFLLLVCDSYAAVVTVCVGLFLPPLPQLLFFKFLITVHVSKLKRKLKNCMRATVRTTAWNFSADLIIFPDGGMKERRLYDPAHERTSYLQDEYTLRSQIDRSRLLNSFQSEWWTVFFFFLVKCSICRTSQLLWQWKFISREGTACSHLLFTH